MARVTVEFDWRELGALSLDGEGKICMPKAWAGPGLYRLVIQELERPAAYIGETESLSRRLQQYRTPGTSQQTNKRVNFLICNALHAGYEVRAEIVTDKIRMFLDGNERNADLSMRSHRLLLEQAALLIALAAGMKILNA